MAQNVPLNKSDVALEPFFDATQELLGAAAPSFTLTVTGTTTVRADAGTVNDQAAIAIEGKYRYRTTAVTATHPGGAAGTHNVYVTASANNFTGLSPNIDITDYNFGLTILTSGTPGGVAHFRKVAEVVWDGTKITSIRRLVGQSRDGDPAYHVAPLAHMAAMTLRAASSQSGNIWEVQNSGGTALVAIRSDGDLTFAGGRTMRALDNSTGAGGALNVIAGGSTGTGGTGGVLALIAGAGDQTTGTSGNGGEAQLRSGAGYNGGAVTITAAQAAAPSGAGTNTGGKIDILAGDGSSNGGGQVSHGGDIVIEAGDARAGTAATGGDVTIRSGYSTTGATDGKVILVAGHSAGAGGTDSEVVVDNVAGLRMQLSGFAQGVLRYAMRNTDGRCKTIEFTGGFNVPLDDQVGYISNAYWNSNDGTWRTQATGKSFGMIPIGGGTGGRLVASASGATDATLTWREAVRWSESGGAAQVGFLGSGPISKPAAYTLNAGTLSRNLASGGAVANVEQVLRQLITDLISYGLLQ